MRDLPAQYGMYSFRRHDPNAIRTEVIGRAETGRHAHLRSRQSLGATGLCALSQTKYGDTGARCLLVPENVMGDGDGPIIVGGNSCATSRGAYPAGRK